MTLTRRIFWFNTFKQLLLVNNVSSTIIIQGWKKT